MNPSHLFRLWVSLHSSLARQHHSAPHRTSKMINLQAVYCSKTIKRGTKRSSAPRRWRSNYLRVNVITYLGQDYITRNHNYTHKSIHPTWMICFDRCICTKEGGVLTVSMATRHYTVTWPSNARNNSRINDILQENSLRPIDTETMTDLFFFLTPCLYFSLACINSIKIDSHHMMQLFARKKDTFYTDLLSHFTSLQLQFV